MTASPDHAFPLGSPEPVPGVTQILMVCQANRCRSPFAAAIARRLADDSLAVSSGGLMPGGHPMPVAGIETGAMLGLDFSSHRSRELDRTDLDGFDLILTMARSQARELVADNPALIGRIFTLKQFSRWIGEHPKPRRMVLGSWLDNVEQNRSRTDFLGEDEADDIIDPIASPVPEWIRMASEMTGLLVPIVDALGSRRD
ncbi:low molecular weight phosphatase family protein [Microbacterium kyungheense]|uniref:protein-tyrosine-phosphatase n=1 Tax=Microbacterium kyungheense TaxID=1263636 RepID=A0A543ERZ9_9MICO|nr:hypothetical protein [Microbacterium kyungheense]TQM24312.1 low molecular weight phosphotyrosine protein phosphatase [Microbacterium kyungheense]